MSAPALAHCRQCALLVAAGEVPARCGDCGAELRRAPVAVAWHPSRGVEGMLRDLTAIRDARLKIRGAPSSMGGILDGLRDGITGRGCKGTKGAGAHEAHEPRPLPSRHPAEALYARLKGDAAKVAALFVEGIVIYSAGEAAKLDGVSLTVDQAVGFRLLTDAERTVVRQKIATRDRRPALTKMEYVGLAALSAAAREWVL